jgi:membrane-associated phospholipid phosphatase
VYVLAPVVDAPIIVGGSVGIVATYALSSKLIEPSCPCDPSHVNALDRHAIGNASEAADYLSDVTVGLAIAGPLIADAAVLGASKPLLEDGVVFAETLVVSGALTTAAKYIAQRPLPRVYADGSSQLARSPGGYRSFYSGHTSIAFAALGAASMTIGYRYDSWFWPWVATVVIGTSVAAERIAAGRHFYTDVIVGAAAGTIVGITVPWAHHRARASGPDWALFVRPSDTSSAIVGLLGSW